MTKVLTASGIILVLAFSRLIPHPPNFTPVAAIALCGGIFLEKRLALFLPLAALFVSDLFIGFHATIPFVYGSFLLTGLIGLWLARRKRIALIVAGALASSILFFLITNFGVWLNDNLLYERSVEGLFACYVSGIPFFRNTVVGDLTYSGALYGLLNLMDSLFRHSRESATARVKSL